MQIACRSEDAALDGGWPGARQTNTRPEFCARSTGARAAVREGVMAVRGQQRWSPGRTSSGSRRAPPALLVLYAVRHRGYSWRAGYALNADVA